MKNKYYEYLAIIVAIAAFIWMDHGFQTEGLYFRVFQPPLIPDGFSFNIFHEGVVLLLSFLGMTIGSISRKLNKKFSVGLILNSSIFVPLLLAVVLNFFGFYYHL